MALVPETLMAEIGDYPRLVRAGWGALLAPVLCLLAPVAEELLFRGLVFGALSRSRIGDIGAAVSSSAAWAALHTGHTPEARLQLFAAGLLLCWAVRRGGSVRVAIWCHVLFNTCLSLLLLAVTAG
jgi:membrane protease YdiL (CAAX protease family)